MLNFKIQKSELHIYVDTEIHNQNLKSETMRKNTNTNKTHLQSEFTKTQNRN